MIDYSKFTKDQIEDLRASYVDNECHTDEYHETQPQKGIQHINRAVKLLKEGEGNDERIAKLLRLQGDWTAAIGNDWYSGSDELEPALRMVFDVLMEKGLHPYDHSELECWEDIKDAKETREWRAANKR